MTLGIDYSQLYGQARTAYLQSNLEEAATKVEEMVTAFPGDANILLLRGNICLGLRQYGLACQQYETVLQLTDEPDLIDYAQQGLEQARQYQTQEQERDSAISASKGLTIAEPVLDSREDYPGWQEETDQENWSGELSVDGLDWDSAVFSEDDLGEPTLGQSQPFANPFEQKTEATISISQPQPSIAGNANPFDDQGQQTSLNWSELSDNASSDYGFPQAEDLEASFSDFPDIGEPTLVVSASLRGEDFSRSQFDDEATIALSNAILSQEAWTEAPTRVVSSDEGTRGEENFLANFSALNEEDLDGISQFDLTHVVQDLPNSDLFTDSNEHLSENLGADSSQNLASSSSPGTVTWNHLGDSTASDQRWLQPTVEVDQGQLTWFKNAPLRRKPWLMAAASGLTVTLTILLFAGMGALLAPKNPSQSVAPAKTEKVSPAKTPSLMPMVWMALLAGLTSFLTTLLFAQILIGQSKRTIDDLQTQFDALYDGDFNVKATVYSLDELGQISARFNQIARLILTTTSDAQRRATETEQAREDLQRQVIRLLDDVEGAARGDLTVEAEVTADVLGAVADAFNLTIQNLREIVRQVKKAAKQVNKNSTDSELFARNNSSDALRMAEELAVTLNSVQMMTESIQRVAENAREAEEVAHTSSVTALKGGEAVERTVAGILQIRETVSETARKVKRLAEASQEISKIVALVSQIASRTNLLALNASIQAARAGEAGRGFAIVADEVRQLADRSAKSLNEIEHIVLQIQSETGSVMTAMEEGIQQVIDVTDKSELAKRSLEDIIEVSNRINSLVRCITGDTVKQQENSRAVTQVMQSVELTAQETSQESQRVAGSLQSLVSISRDLLGSVERFCIEKSQQPTDKSGA